MDQEGQKKNASCRLSCWEFGQDDKVSLLLLRKKLKLEYYVSYYQLGTRVVLAIQVLHRMLGNEAVKETRHTRGGLFKCFSWLWT